ncbi:MAG: hypothetical protein RLZZ111_1819 [Planctomycetota bacterium]|jgi:hypothetical protein
MPASLPRHSSDFFIAALLVAAFVPGPVLVAEPEPAGGPPRPAGLKRLAPDEEVWIDPVAKAVVVGCTVAIDRGPIEYFACTKGSKEHESVVAARSSARLVHAALLAVGLVPGKPVSFQPEYVPASGPVVRVRMRWRAEDGSVREAAGQDWIRDTRTGARMREDWVFAGSTFWKDPADGTEHYQADGGDLVCVSNFPTAMLDIPIESSQSNDALLFEAFTGRVPPSGTKVDMVLSAAADPAR